MNTNEDLTQYIETASRSLKIEQEYKLICPLPVTVIFRCRHKLYSSRKGTARAQLQNILAINIAQNI
jgi:hypothetical protein